MFDHAATLLFAFDHFHAARETETAVPPAPSFRPGIFRSALSGFTSFVSHVGGPPIMQYQKPRKNRLACWLLGPALAMLLLGGCVYLPETTVRYDEKCGILERKMTMQPYQVGSLMGCRDEGCVTGLVAAGVVSAASAVVTGSVVVIGNVVNWLEKQGQCLNPAHKTGDPGSPPAK